MGLKPKKSNIGVLCLVIAFFAAIIAFSGITNALPQIQVVNVNPAVSAEIAQNIPTLAPTPTAAPTSGYERCKTDGIFCGACDDGKDIPNECALVNARTYKKSLCFTTTPLKHSSKTPSLPFTLTPTPQKPFPVNTLKPGYYSWCDARTKIENLNAVPYPEHATIHFSFTTTTDAKATVKITGKNTATTKTFTETNPKNTHWTNFNSLPADEYSYEITACNALHYCNQTTGSLVLSPPNQVNPPQILSPQPSQAYDFEAQPIQATFIVTGSAPSYSTQVTVDSQTITTTQCANNTPCTALLPVLAAGTHSLEVNASTQTSSAHATTQFTVTPSTPTLTLSINGANADQTITQHETIEVKAVLSTQGNLSLYENGSLALQGPSPLQASRSYHDAGTINLTAYYPGNQNYSPATTTRWLTIQPASNPRVDPPTITSPQNTSYDYQAQPITLSFKVTGSFSSYQAQYVLDEKTALIGATLNNSIESIALPVLATGTHSIKVVASQASYSNESQTVHFTVAPSTPTLALA
ncbi:MAG: hypothetical protein ACP5IG_04715, partial [Candidatus Micrarchaeia archaeon]